jgi:ribosomal protein S18 acetylase RimI-like enzyme
MKPPVVPAELRHIESFGDCVAEVARERRYLAIVDGFTAEQNALWVAVNRARGNPLYVALDADRVIGWSEVRRESLPGREHSGTLGIGVRAAFRRAGIGRRLMAAALDAAWERGFERVELWVRSTNGVAIHLYQGFGFVQEGRRRDAVRLDDGPEDEILMALLAPMRERAANPAAPHSARPERDARSAQR